jgi:hypothetical protein
MCEHPHAEILVFWQRFLNLLDGNWPPKVILEYPDLKLDSPIWPGTLEHDFRSAQHLPFEEWYEKCKQLFTELERTPIHILKSHSDFERYRDEEAELTNEQITVTINLWHTVDEIKSALEPIFKKSPFSRKGNPHRGWDTEAGYHIVTARSSDSLKEILYVLQEVKKGKSNVEIHEMLCSPTSHESAANVSKRRSHGFAILKNLRRGTFPKSD